MNTVRRLAAITVAALLPAYLPLARYDGDPHTKSRVHRVPDVVDVLAPVLQTAPAPTGPEPLHEEPIDWDQPTLCGECGFEAASARTLALHEAWGHMTCEDIDSWGEEDV